MTTVYVDVCSIITKVCAKAAGLANLRMFERATHQWQRRMGWETNKQGMV